MPKGIYIRTEKHRKNIGLALRGRTLSKEHKKKISNALKGYKNFLGKTHSEITKKKLSIANKGKILSKEHKKKISDTEQGKIISEETKQKLREHWVNGRYDKAQFYTSSYYRKDIGHFVRSSWEANFARILNHCDIAYEYENYYFDTSLGTYTPDFYLPQRDIYVEIKGWEYKESKQKRKRNICRKEYRVKIKMIRWEQYKKLQNSYSHLISKWEV